MRLTVLFILLVLLQMAKGNAYGQSAHLDLSFENARLGNVLNAIETQSKFRFAYNAEFINLNRIVSIKISNASIQTVLDNLVRDSGIKYEIKDRHIILLPADLTGNPEPDKSITGTVKENNGQPLPGVVVCIEGTAIGILTDTDGKFSLKLPAEVNEPIIVFSFLGMVTQRIKPDNSAVFNVTMYNATIDLDELVIVGYGMQKKPVLSGLSPKFPSMNFSRHRPPILQTVWPVGLPVSLR